MAHSNAARQSMPPTGSVEQQSGTYTTDYTIGRRARYWEVIDPTGVLVCLTVYKRGAKEVVRRLSR
jgi:hypothetical protein